MHILIDIGGTNTRIASTKDSESFSEPVIFDTPQNFEIWLTKLKEVIPTLLGEQALSTIIAGVPATLTENKTTIKHAPHLTEWNSINLVQTLSETFSCTVLLENDTALVGLGEAVYGSGKGYDIVVYLTISTGVGGVRIVDGKIDRNKFGFEIGHQIVHDNKELEYYISGSSLERRYNLPSKENKNPDLWREVDYYTGILAANTIMYWSPAIIIFGGPVMRDIHLDIVENTARKLTSMYETLPLLTRSSLGALGGLYGAMVISRKV
jgi:predicted NBD/HSP70 family sugar kinase